MRLTHRPHRPSRNEPPLTPSPTAALPAADTTPSYPRHSALRAELKLAVDGYFREAGLDAHGGGSAALKAALIAAWAVASWALLVWWASSWWAALPLAISLGLALAGVGFAIMHDGGHGASSGRRGLNRLAAASLDLMGGSSYVWHVKHNLLHHTYPNVEGMDDDIEFLPFFRLAPGQPRRWFHRWQHLYWAPLFLFFTTKWIFVDDFLAVARGAVGRHPLPRPGRLQLLGLCAGKLTFVTWALIVPLLWVPVLPWLLGYLLVSLVWGLTLGVVFQLAHVVEGTRFVPGAVALPAPWVEHQLATTADFARHNRLLTWYVGGLNHQVEHHLFPRVAHRHYPALARIVREVCARHGITPLEHTSCWSAFRAHLRHLRDMGRPLAA